MNSTRALTICQACAVAAFIAVCVVVELAGYATARLPRGYEPRDHFDHTTPALEAGGRTLLDDEVDERPYIVVTAEGLLEALLKGRRNIEISAHLDLTTLPLLRNTGCEDGCDSPLPPITTLTKSIRGSCTGPPTEEELAPLAGFPGAVSLLPFQEGQCLVLVQEDNFRAMAHRLWLDNLYLRLAYTGDAGARPWGYISLASFVFLHWPVKGQGRRYVTRTTFQGDSTGPGVGLWAEENTYIENCTFANLGGNSSDGCTDCSSAVVVKNASVTIVNSTFFEPVDLPGGTYVRAIEGGRVLLSGNVFAAAPQTGAELFYDGGNATFYADDPAVRIRNEDGTVVVTALPLSEVPEAATGSKRAFPARSDEWFVFRRSALEQTLEPQPAYAAPTTPVALLDIAVAPADAPADADASSGADAAGVDDADDDDDDGDGDGPSAGAIAAIVLATLLLFVTVLALCLCARLRKSREASGKGAVAEEPGAAGQPHSVAKAPPLYLPGAAPTLPWDKPRAVAGPSGAPIASATSLASTKTASSREPWTGGDPVMSTLGAMDDESTEATNLGAGSMMSLPVPPAGASREARLSYIQMQLSSISSEAAVLQQYKLLGEAERRQGDQSVVALSTGAYDREPYALKFFAERAAFDAEVALQRGSAVAALLPQIHAVYDPDVQAAAQSGATDGYGQPLPPCIVYGRGESLTLWLKRAKTDVFQAVSVLSHIATRLGDIHAANFVHCDIKPAHILLLQRQNRWTVIDFDKAAAVGAAVAPAYTLDYAAPEVVAASDGRMAIPAQPAMDAWALGVIAFELLTGKKALDPATDGNDSVMAQLRGDAELPWEGDRLTDETRHQLGVFCDTVLGMLRRDPAQRATVRDLCGACENVVTSSTTVGH